MNNTIMRMKETLKRLPDRINITQVEFDTLFSRPIEVFENTIDYLYNNLKTFGTWMGILVALTGLLVLMPALELFIFGLKLAKFPINLWIGSSKRVLFKTSSLWKYPFKLKKTKGKWDENTKSI